MGAIDLSVIGIALLHTVSGPDHYLPFVVLSKSGKWSKRKTFFWTTLCGIAHVITSVLLAVLFVLIGKGLQHFYHIDEIRGDWASYGLIIFGVLYSIWGIYVIVTDRKHKHFDITDDEIYVFEHSHHSQVLPQNRFKVTPFVMLFIFALGPTEPLVPLMSFPALNGNYLEAISILMMYLVITVVSMLLMVFVFSELIEKFRIFQDFEKVVPLLGGITLVVLGLGMKFWGW